MYGPPPDPRQIPLPAGVQDEPFAFALCAVVSLLGLWLSTRKTLPQPVTAGCFITSQVVLLTAPLLGLLNRSVYGSYPTIDKEGSFLFYGEKVHIEMLLAPMSPEATDAAALIGVHVGHLWVSELFDLVLTSHGAFNAQGLVNLLLAWFCSWGLLRSLCGSSAIAIVMGFAYGMQLHIFRDLNWYTIEKSAAFTLPLYLWMLHVQWRNPRRWYALLTGVCFAGICWLNLYLGMLCGLFCGFALLSELISRKRKEESLVASNLMLPTFFSVLLALPLMLWQGWLLRNAPQLASPAEFLWQRAALDTVTLWPLQWNRMEMLAALSPLPLAVAVVGMRRCLTDNIVALAMLCAVVMGALSLGPSLAPPSQSIVNPVYMMTRAVVPGFWRIAKPEVFFFGTWLCMIVIATRQLASMKVEHWKLMVMYVVMVLMWFVLVRGHPVYPSFSNPMESHLTPNWHQQTFPENR